MQIFHFYCHISKGILKTWEEMQKRAINAVQRVKHLPKEFMAFSGEKD